MKQVKKYPLISKGTIVAPPDWNVVIVGHDERGCLCLWAEIDPNGSEIGHFYEVAASDIDHKPDPMLIHRGQITNHAGVTFEVYCS